MPVNRYGQPIGEPCTFTGARAPGPVTLAGRSCALVPLIREHAADLLAAVEAVGGDEQWTYLFWQPAHDVAAMTAVIDGLVADPGCTPFAILVDGRAAGAASLMRAMPAAGSIEVGSILLGAGVRRATPGTEMIRLLAEHVFTDLGFRRFEWKCDDLNAPSRRAAERFGFSYEGTFRQAVVYKGRTRDTAWYAMTDADWTRLRPGYEAWLDDPGAGSLRERLG